MASVGLLEYVCLPNTFSSVGDGLWAVSECFDIKFAEEGFWSLRRYGCHFVSTTASSTPPNPTVGRWVTGFNKVKSKPGVGILSNLWGRSGERITFESFEESVKFCFRSGVTPCVKSIMTTSLFDNLGSSSVEPPWSTCAQLAKRQCIVSLTLVGTEYSICSGFWISSKRSYEMEAGSEALPSTRDVLSVPEVTLRWNLFELGSCDCWTL